MGTPSFRPRPTSGLLLLLPPCGPDSPTCEFIHAWLEILGETLEAFIVTFTVFFTLYLINCGLARLRAAICHTREDFIRFDDFFTLLPYRIRRACTRPRH